MQRLSQSISLSFIALTTLAVTGCATPRTEGDPWQKGYRAPRELDTRYTHLEPLAPVHAQLDYNAAMSSREHLNNTLHWGWPTEGFTVEQNAKDLERHWNEFIQNEGYAYTVLAPSRDECLGCVYLKPANNEELDGPSAKLAMWVTEKQLDNNLDEHLFTEIIRWIRKDWPIETVVMKLHNDNKRMMEIARKARLDEEPESETHTIFTWTRK